MGDVPFVHIRPKTIRRKRWLSGAWAEGIVEQFVQGFTFGVFESDFANAQAFGDGRYRCVVLRRAFYRLIFSQKFGNFQRMMNTSWKRNGLLILRLCCHLSYPWLKGGWVLGHPPVKGLGEGLVEHCIEFVVEMTLREGLGFVFGLGV